MPKNVDPGRFADLFAEFGPVSVRRFFGGEGIFAGDVMLGMVFDDKIYLKTDAETRRGFVAEKCKPFTFRKGGETIITGYYTIPDRLYDEPEELAAWARAALRIASASPTAEKKRRKRARATAARSPKRRKRA